MPYRNPIWKDQAYIEWRHRRKSQKIIQTYLEAKWMVAALPAWIPTQLRVPKWWKSRQLIRKQAIWIICTNRKSSVMTCLQSWVMQGFKKQRRGWDISWLILICKATLLRKQDCSISFNIDSILFRWYLKTVTKQERPIADNMWFYKTMDRIPNRSTRHKRYSN